MKGNLEKSFSISEGNKLSQFFAFLKITIVPKLSKNIFKMEQDQPAYYYNKSKSYIIKNLKLC